jgi:hypothetical protein
MMNGYQVSQALHVAASLGIPNLLGDGPRTLDELAGETGTHAPALYRLLRALAGIGVFEEVDGRFGQTSLSEHLRTDLPGSIGHWAVNMGRPHHWNTWGNLIESVRSGESAFRQNYGMTVWEYRAEHPEDRAIFDTAMTALSAGVVDAVVRGYDFSPLHVLVDVGGGEGSLLAAVLKANPHLRGILFDQPGVTAEAGPLLQKAGVAGRCEIVSGSFFDAVPAGADAYLLKSILHDWDDAEAAAILRRCREAIADSGKLLVVERVIRAGNEPDAVKFSDLNMLVMLGGRERSADDFRGLFSAAGFDLTRIVPTDTDFNIVEGVPV